MFFALLTSRCQVSVYRTNGPLVVSKPLNDVDNNTFRCFVFTLLSLFVCLFCCCWIDIQETPLFCEEVYDKITFFYWYV